MSKFNRRFKVRPLSYSQLASFEYSPEQWYRQYVLGEKDPPNPAMLYGTVVGDSIGTEASLVPTLTPPGVKEYEMRANLGDVHIVGYADHYCTEQLHLEENKTSDNATRWDQDKVDKHGQLTMYALLLFLQDGTKPEDVFMRLNFIPVAIGGDFQYYIPDVNDVRRFDTRRTTRDIMEYSKYILETVKRMEEYYLQYE